MRIRGSLLFIGLVTLLALPHASVAADPDKTVSPFLEPLRKHDAAIRAACEPFEQMAGWTLPDRDSLRAPGRQLLKTTIAFEKTARAFVQSSTRRGLGEELDIITRGCNRLSNAGRILRQVSAVQLPPAELSGWEKALNASVKLAHTWMMVEVTQELIAKGPWALLEARSFEDVQNKAWARMQQEVDRFRSRIDQKVRTLDKYFAPLELLEAEGVAGFLKIKAREKVRALIAALVVDISSHGLVVRLAGEVIYNIAANILWPKLRELFREKGNLDLRVPRSLETLEASRLELNKLGSVRGSAQVKLADVRRTVARAHSRMAAMRFLERDVTRAKREDLAKRMVAGTTNLQRSISLTEKRFLLDKVEEIETLAPRVALLGPLSRGIRKVLEALDGANLLSGRDFFVQHGNMIEEQIAQKGRKWRPSQFPSPPLFAWLYVVNRDARAKARERHLSAGRSAEDFDETSPMFTRQYEPPCLFKAECNGQMLYQYGFRTKGGTFRTYGNGKACGLPDGRHQVKLTVYSSEGFQLYFGYTIVVKKGRKALRALGQLEAAEQKVEDAWTKYYAAQGPEERTLAMSGIASQESKLALIQLESGAGTANEVMRLTHASLEHFVQSHPEGSPTSTWWTRFFKLCREVGDAKAYELYTEGWKALEPRISDDPKKRARKVMNHEWALASLAIGAYGDVERARGHMQKALQARERGAVNTNRPGWKQKSRENWPRPVGGGGSAAGK